MALTPDRFNNVIAEEGLTLCACGCKYWENDLCTDCGSTPPRTYWTPGSVSITAALLAAHTKEKDA